MSAAEGGPPQAPSTLVVVDGALMPAALEQTLTDVARLGDHVLLLGLIGTEHSVLSQAQTALRIAGIDVETVLALEPDPVDALIVELDQRAHDLVVIFIDHFAASALGAVADAARALIETAQRGASLTFVAPRLLPA